MLERIVLFMPLTSQYQVLHAFTQSLAKALERQGIECKVIETNLENTQQILGEIIRFSPDCTLSFNGILPDPEGRFLCDMIQTPHIACLVDSPIHFLPLQNSSLTIITCVDRFFCEFFRQTKKDQVLFMPHAIDKGLYHSPEAPRCCEAVMLATCIDCESIWNEWQRKYPQELCEVLDEVVRKVFSDQQTSCIEAFGIALNEAALQGKKIEIQSLDTLSILLELEDYVNGKDRFELLNALKDEVEVHLFGGGLNGAQWSQFYPKGESKIVVHGPVSYQEAHEAMKKSKILLNSCPKIKNGSHERIFDGYACGALVVTAENPYVKKQFTENEEILFYRYGQWKEVVNKIKEYLANEKKRSETASRAYKKVLENHTWDQRAKMLAEHLPQLLDCH